MATVITNKGLALLAKLTQGNALEITSAKTGAGTVDASLLQQQTAVTNQKQIMTIKSINYPEDGKCALVLSVTNDGVASGYTIMQVGIYAQDPDEGELLFSIWQIDSGSGINIPSEAVLPGYNAEMNYYIKYDQADSVNVNVDPSNTVSQAAMEAYVNKEAKSVVDAHTANNNNPHGVTASQVGAATSKHTHETNGISNLVKVYTMESETADSLALTLGRGHYLSPGQWLITSDTVKTAIIHLFKKTSGTSSKEVFRVKLPAMVYVAQHSTERTVVVDMISGTIGTAELSADGENYDITVETVNLAYAYGTQDLIEGSSELQNGKLYFVYE